MDRNTALIFWTAIWLIFIGTLCFIFQNGHPLWLLILWILAFEEEVEE